MYLKHLLPNLPSMLFILAFSACDNPKAQSSDKREAARFSSPAIETSFQEVMAIHDEVMPFISKMKSNKRQLAQYQEQLVADTSTPTEKVFEVKEAIQLLVQGDSLMFDWMKNFKSPGPDIPEEEALPYLTEEKEKIVLVSSKMKEAMQKSETILAIIPQ